MEHKKHIDGLRALAVLAVFFYHLNVSFTPGGFVGVDIFFVISGYLITAIILKELKETGHFCFVNFYFRRTKRILPAFIFTLLICLLFSIWLLKPTSFRVFGATLATAAIFVSNIFLSGQTGYFDISAKHNPLLHSWSLSVEEQFYIFWPLILFVTFRCIEWKQKRGSEQREREREREGGRGTWIIIVIIGAASFCLNTIDETKNSSAIFYLTQYRVFEFCIGALILYIPQKMSARISVMKECLCCLGFLLIMCPIFSYTENIIFPSYNALMPALGTALLIYAGDAKYSGWMLRNKAAVLIGLISYSLYLVHWPLIVLFKAYNENINFGVELLRWDKILLLSAAVLLACLMYQLIEQPARHVRINQRHQQVFFILKRYATLLLIVPFGVSIFYSNGWLWRVNVLAIAGNVTEFHLKNWGGAGFNGGIIYAGKRPEPTIVLMGDSHSGMYITGIVEEIAQPLNLTVFNASGGGTSSYPSALLLPGTTKFQQKEGQTLFSAATQDANAAMLKELSRSNNSVLIYSANYAWQLPTAGNFGADAPWGIVPSTTNNPEDYKPFINALERLRITLDGKKFLIIGNVPFSSEYDTPRCLAQLRWFPSSECLPAGSRFNNPAAMNINKILRDYAHIHAKNNVYFIDPYDTLCDDSKCKNVDQDGNPIYSDKNHLSKEGSKYFLKSIRNELIRILSAPPT